MLTPPTRFSGLKTAESFKKVFQGGAPTGDSSPEAEPPLHETVQALTDWIQDHHMTLVKLRRQVGRLSFVCLLVVVFYGISVYWILNRFQQIETAQKSETEQLHRDLISTQAANSQLRSELSSLENRLGKVELFQATYPPPAPTPVAPAPTLEAP